MSTAPPAPRRVMHVLADLRPGGGQQVVLGLLEGIDRRRFVPSLAVLDPPLDLIDRFRGAGVEVEVLGRARSGRAAQLEHVGRAIALVRSRQVDLLHVHSDRDRRVGHLAALATGRPAVGHLHAPWDHLAPLCGTGAGPVRRRWSASKARLRSTVEARAVRRYVAAGEAIADFHRGRLRRPIRTVPNGVDTTRFAPANARERDAARAELGLAPECAVAVCVARLVDGKGHADLIDVVRRLEGAQLLLVGDGELRAQIEQLAHELEVAERVVVLGDRADVTTPLHAADVFVLASRTEGHPVAVLEAMSCGLPVVAYDIPGLRAVLDDGVEGRLVPLSDRDAFAGALDAQLRDAAARARLGAAARQRTRSEASLQTMVRAVEDVYDEVLDQAGAGVAAGVGAGR